MSKLFKISEVNEALFDGVITVTDLQHFINYAIVGVDKQNEVIKVSKTNAAVKFLNDIDVIFFVVEKVFDGLTDIQRLYLIEDAVTSIVYNTERDSVKIEPHDVNTSSGVLDKYKLETYLKLQQTIRDVIAQLKEKEAEEKGK